MNEQDLNPADTELSARIATYELAYRMQSAAPEAVDLASESDRTKAMYGLDDPRTVEFGTRCLLARRLVERGVRFVQLYSGGGPVAMQWDAHDDISMVLPLPLLASRKPGRRPLPLVLISPANPSCADGTFRDSNSPFASCRSALTV